jgi:translation initiation factor IF-1
MGADEAVSGTGRAPLGRACEGTVLELLPSGMYRVELSDRRRVLGHLAGATKRAFVRLRVGDRVEVETSPHDAGRARITRLLGKRK